MTFTIDGMKTLSVEFIPFISDLRLVIDKFLGEILGEISDGGSTTMPYEETALYYSEVHPIKLAS
jgi:hypothetical protein